MKTPNYKQVAELLYLKEPFVHQHSMSAVIQDDKYEIYSYRTLIATYNFSTGEWWLNQNKYSMTTSKQQTLIRVAAQKDGWEKPLEII